MEKHTPTERPWFHKDCGIYANNGAIAYAINDVSAMMSGAENPEIYPSPSKARANADLIVRAVNSHDDLVKLLEDLILTEPPVGDDDDLCRNILLTNGEVKEIQKILKKAKGE